MPRASSQRAARALPLLLALLVSRAAAADEPLRALAATDFGQQISAMRSLVAACAAKAEGCDSAVVSPDSKVGEPGKDGGYAVHWIWLRTALDDARKAKPEERASAMKEAAARLDELERQMAAPAPAPALQPEARTKVNAILAQPEFQQVKGTSWLDRTAAKFWEAIASLFRGAGKVGHSAPWIGPLLEWGFFLAAAAGLAFVILRGLARQRLQVKLSAGPAGKAAIWDRESTDWARDADERAAAGDWREALHALYWAAILHLESRKAWRHDPSRTPREYVRLLPPGSDQRDALRQLTRTFERVWYGLEPSNASEYGEARAFYERVLKSAAATPAGSPATPPATNPATTGGAA